MTKTKRKFAVKNNTVSRQSWDPAIAEVCFYFDNRYFSTFLIPNESAKYKKKYRVTEQFSTPTL